MRRRRGWALVGGSTALSFLVVVVAALLLAHRTTLHADHAVVPGPVYFDYGIVFTPRALPTGAKYLSADEAWMKWEDGDHVTPDITTEFGMLMDQGRYHLAWGFSQRGCTMPLGYPSAHQVALARSPKCRHWTFLNPTTGRQILGTDLYPTEP